MPKAIDRSPLFALGPQHKTATCYFCRRPLVSILDGRVWRCQSDDCFKRAAPFIVDLTEKKTGHLLGYAYIPLPIQIALHEAIMAQKARRILFGGSAGVSKSHAIRWAF